MKLTLCAPVTTLVVAEGGKLTRSTVAHCCTPTQLWLDLLVRWFGWGGVEIRNADMLANNNRMNNSWTSESAEFWAECEIYCLLGFDLEKCGKCVKMAWLEREPPPQTLTDPDEHRRLCRPTVHADPTGKWPLCQMVSPALPATIHLQLFCVSMGGTWQPYAHI